MTLFLVRALITLLLFLLGGSTVYGDSYPLMLRSQALSQAFRASPQPQSAKAPKKDSLQFSLSQSWANYWGYDKRYIVDGQISDLIFNMNWQLSSFLSLTFEANQRQLNASKTDQIAIGFHHLFGIPQDNRDRFERNRTRFSIPDYGLYLTEEQAGINLSETFGGKVNGYWGLSSQGGLALSLGSYYEHSSESLYQRKAVDYLIQASFYYDTQYGQLYGNMNHMLFRGSDESVLYMRDQQWSFLMGYGYTVSANNEILFESLLSQSPFDNLGQLSLTSYELHLGYRKKWNTISYELVLIENVIWPYNSPDFGFALALSFIKY